MVGLTLSTMTAQAARPAIDGTVANQVATNWSEFNVGGIQNRSTVSRDWLLAMPADTCFDTTPCQMSATIKAGAAGNSTAIAYAVNNGGFFTAATALAATSSTSLVTLSLGLLNVPSHILLVSRLAGASTTGGTNGGAMTSGAAL
jgi:hypothetical protein